MKIITDTGMRIFPIYQTIGNNKDYFTVNQSKIDALNRGDKLTRLATDFMGKTGVGLGLMMDLVDKERHGEAITMGMFVMEIIDALTGEVLDAVFKSIFLSDLTEGQDTVLSSLYTIITEVPDYYSAVKESTDSYITEYAVKPGGGDSGSDGQRFFTIYVGDALMQVKLIKDEKHIGDYYVYMRNFIPRCV